MDVAFFLRELPNNDENRVIRFQLIKSSSSSAVNYEEAQGGESKADLIHKTRIAQKEMRESHFWLRYTGALLDRKNLILQRKNQDLIDESKELMKILASIIIKTIQGEEKRRNLTKQIPPKDF